MGINDSGAGTAGEDSTALTAERCHKQAEIIAAAVLEVANLAGLITATGMMNGFVSRLILAFPPEMRMGTIETFHQHLVAEYRRSMQ